MKVSVVLSTLVVLFVFICATTARQPRSQPWLAVLSFTCRRSTNNCIGVVLDDQWVLTTATCFRKCRVEIPLQVSVYVNIPPGAQRRLATSIRLGTKVNGSLVWQHPEYTPNTFANNLALVKLGCHNHTLEKLKLASNCSGTESQKMQSDGYVYAKNRVIKFKNAKGSKTECFSKLGTSTLYYLASTLEMITTTSNNSSCMDTPICKHTEQLKSFMQGNKPNCTNTIQPPIILLESVPVPAPAIISELIINDTIIKPSLIRVLEVNNTTSQLTPSTQVTTSITSTQETATSVVKSTSVKAPEMPTSSQVASSTVIPTPVSVSIAIEVPVSTTSISTQVSTLTEMPTSTKMAPTSTVISSPSTDSSIPTETPVSTATSTSTRVQVSTSTEIPTSTKAAPTSTVILPSLSTSSSISTQVSTLAKTETTTEASTIPTSSSTQISTSTQVSESSSSVMPSSTAVETSSSQAIVSTQVPTTTPTETPTSGCQLTIQNGKVDSRIIAPGFMLLTYTCNPGYRFKTGTKPLTYGCTGGVMAIRPPPCELIACPPIEPLADGRVVATGRGLGATATYSCNEGFILSDGFTVRVCMENHEWTGKVGVCTRACPILPSLVCNDGQRILPSAFKYSRIGESASYSERDGYTLIGENPVCQSDSTWSAPPRCIKLCDEKEVIPNAKILIQRNASSYTRKIVCDEGYEPVGFDEQRCTDYGQWTPNFQECTKTCDQITLVSGSVRMLKSQSFLIAIMECDEGFHLEPALSAIACANGEWTPSIPSCIEDK